MKMILHFMRDYKKESILAPLFKMLEAMQRFRPLAGISCFHCARIVSARPNGFSSPSGD